MSGSQAFREGASPWKAGLWTGLWMALATLTKGPVGIGLPALALLTMGLTQRQIKALFQMGLTATIPVILFIGSWISLLYFSDKGYLISDFWAYQWRLFPQRMQVMQAPGTITWFYGWWGFSRRRPGLSWPCAAYAFPTSLSQPKPSFGLPSGRLSSSPSSKRKSFTTPPQATLA